MKAVIVILAILAGITASQARIITVDDDGPADFSTIQTAIDDANDGDKVIVADGHYSGPGNQEISFLGKAITVRSENGAKDCIVDGEDVKRCFIFENGEDANALLDGFTITRGKSTWGGGIGLYFSSPTIANCVITGNKAYESVSCDPLSGICIYSGGTGGGSPRR
ncbi:MAG: hypothetical protein JXN61_13500 [Sedimentisphaerales bacterium]|nr:hypothetical protein [Sedimentisphaerales bacterium]